MEALDQVVGATPLNLFLIEKSGAHAWLILAIYLLGVPCARGRYPPF